jgi:hypothetical protein
MTVPANAFQQKHRRAMNRLQRLTCDNVPNLRLRAA